MDVVFLYCVFLFFFLMKWNNFTQILLELSKIHIATFSSLDILFVSSMNHSLLKQMKAALAQVHCYEASCELKALK